MALSAHLHPGLGRRGLIGVFALAGGRTAAGRYRFFPMAGSAVITLGMCLLSLMGVGS